MLADLTKDELIALFAQRWDDAERAIAANKELSQLSPLAAQRLQDIITFEWGEEYDDFAENILRQAVDRGNGYRRSQQRADALYPLVVAWEKEHGEPTEWYRDEKCSPFVEWLVKVMKGHDQAKHFATPRSIRTLLEAQRHFVKRLGAGG